MNTRNSDDRKEATGTELDDLDQRIDELHQQGILIGGEGPRESLRPIAYIPGALQRFMERRNRG